MLEKFKALNEEWLKIQKMKVKDRPRIVYPKNMLDKLLPIFAKQKLKGNEAGLVSASTTIDAIEDKQVMEALKFVYNVNRGELIEGTINHDPLLGTFTPIFMYAHKLYHNVTYDQWDKTDKFINYILGRNLEPILEVKNEPVFNMQEERAKALTYKSGIKAGKMESLISNKMNTQALELVPKIAKYMYLQTWLANASVRNEESMILDPLNWGGVPEAVDEKVEIKKKNTVRKKVRNNFWV